jgi:predicted outer membrane repeat protein
MSLMAFCPVHPEEAIQINYRSIGTAKGILYKTGTATVAAAQTTVTFSEEVCLPENIGLGDRLVIGKEVLFLLSRKSDIQVVLQQPALHNHFEEPYAITRAHRSIQAWENARDGDLVGDDRLEVGVCYNDGPFRSPGKGTLAVIDGSQTDAEHFMWLTAAESARHNGIAGQGVVLDGNNQTKFGIRIHDDYSRIEWLEMRRFRFMNGSASVKVTKARNVRLGQLLIHNFYSRWFRAAGIMGSKDSDFTAQNCIIYDGDSIGIWTDSREGTATIENCTIYGMRERGIDENAGIYSVTNTISMGNQKEDFRVIQGVQVHNMSSDDTASGQNSLVQHDPLDQFVSLACGKKDFHLKENADAIDAGMDPAAVISLMSRANVAEADSFDIDGTARPSGSGWDIGADEFAVLSNGIWHVDSEGSGNGTSWQKAFGTIQAAVQAAKPGEQIWVKAGVYHLPAEITINKAISIYGGFAGSETESNPRNWQENATIVVGGQGLRCFTIQGDGVGVDGFIFEDGSGDAGGAIGLANATGFVVRNCTFRYNSADFGGAIASRGATGEIINCIFTDNSATTSGGAIDILDSALIIANCIFSANAAGTNGGAIYNSASNTIITNCSFAGNETFNGGAIYNENSDPAITNSILWGNTAVNRNAIYDDRDDPEDGVRASANVTYSSIDDNDYAYKSGARNRKYDPIWTDDFHLQPGSPCINMGKSDAVGIQETDFEGDPRIIGVRVDMGADEFVE